MIIGMASRTGAPRGKKIAWQEKSAAEKFEFFCVLEQRNGLSRWGPYGQKKLCMAAGK
jgi:hypothetical protein